MNEIVLEGCTATPLAGYLKALGVLRLISAKYPETRGAWRGERFVLITSLDRDGIKEFFLNDYVPTPIISPWSGRAGFLEGDDGQDSKRKGAVILGRIEAAVGKRFEQYRRVVSAIRNVPVIQQLDKARVVRKRLEALKKAKNLDQAGADRLSERIGGDVADAVLRLGRHLGAAAPRVLSAEFGGRCLLPVHQPALDRPRAGGVPERARPGARVHRGPPALVHAPRPLHAPARAHGQRTA